MYCLICIFDAQAGQAQFAVMAKILKMNADQEASAKPSTLQANTSSLANVAAESVAISIFRLRWSLGLWHGSRLSDDCLKRS
jgi:hypothetical protein